MKLKNHEINGFVQFLMRLDLEGKESRMRTRLVKILVERMQMIEEERIQMVQKYAEKNEDGTPIIVTNEDGGSAYQVSDMGAFANEYAVLMNEDCIIDNNEERKDMLLTVKDAVLNTKIKFSGQDAFDYDRYCDIVETVNYAE